MKSTIQAFKHFTYPLFVLSLFVLNPLIFSAQTVDITYTPQFYFLGITCSVFILLFWLFNKLNRFLLPINTITIAIGGYFIFTLLSVLITDYRQEGIIEMYKLVSWIMLITIFQFLIKNETQIIGYILKSFVVSGFILSIIGFMQLIHLAFISIPGNIIPYGTLGNRNIFIPAILLMVPFIIYHAIYCSSKNWKILSVFTGSLILIVILWSVMRTALLALFIAGIVNSIFIIMLHPKVKLFLNRFKTLSIVLLAIFIILISGIGFSYFKKLYLKNDSKSELLNLTSTNERTALWNNSWHMFSDYPLTGVGAGNWKIMLPNYGLKGLPPEARRAEMYFIRPENDFIWVFAETGFLGGLCYLGIFILSMLSCVSKIKKATNKREVIFAIAIINALIIYMIIAFFGFPKDRTFLHTELALIIAFSIHFYDGSNKFRSVKIPTILLLFAFLLFTYKGFHLFAAEKKLSKLIEARKNNAHKLVLNYADGILKNNYLMDQTSTPIYFYEGVALFSMQIIDKALVSFHKAEQQHPYHLHVLNNLATCYAIKGDFNKSSTYLNEALRISPDFQDAIINMAALHYNNNNFKEACRYFFLARTDNKQNPLYVNLDAIISKTINDSLLLKATVYIENGELEKAEACLKKCVHVNKLPEHHNLKVAIIRKRQQLKAHKR